MECLGRGWRGVSGTGHKFRRGSRPELRATRDLTMRRGFTLQLLAEPVGEPDSKKPANAAEHN